MTGIAILLKDLVTHGDVAISFDDHAATLANAPRDVVQKDERGNND